MLLAHGLDTSAIVTLAGRETPAVTQELVSGAPGRHRFSFSCPSCHKLFPRSPGITLAMAASIADRLDEAQAFFFDRAAPGSLQLAAAAGARELLVMFEPNNIRPSSMYAGAAELSDVVKYSSDADAETQSWAPSSSARTKLIVQTLGSDGAMYRLRQPNGSWRDWSRLPGFCAQVVEDTAGAGDWCSAGLLHHLLRSPSAERFAETNIERAIQFGQALAAASVSFRGPQGALNQMEMRFLSRMARAAMHSGRVRVPEVPGKLARSTSLSTVPQAACATCLSPPAGRRLMKDSRDGLGIASIGVGCLKLNRPGNVGGGRHRGSACRRIRHKVISSIPIRWSEVMADTRRPAAETGLLARSIYERDVHQHVEGVHDGDFIAIDVDSGRWARAGGRRDASRCLREEHPDAVNVYVMRVGYRGVAGIGGGTLRIRE